MNRTLKANFDHVWSDDRELQNQAFFHILKATDQPVDWAYEVWDEIVENLKHKDNHNRAIAAQILCNLAKSDGKKRMAKDFQALLTATKDERFVTARHCMQALWKVGAAGKEQQMLLMDGLEGRFKECVTEKNCTLIRHDIVQSFRNLYDAVKDESVKAKAMELIEIENDSKYRKKYASLWKIKKSA
jgi:hypothetical protein